MSDYTAATATKLLATSCLACGRPLLDAASVEAGVGPVCRERWGYGEIANDVRVAANALIHEAARKETPLPRRAEIAEELTALGAPTLAAKIIARFMKAGVTVAHQSVTIGRGQYEKQLDGLFVTTAYSPEFTDALKETVDFRDRSPVFGKKADGSKKFLGWALKPEAAPALWHVVRRCFAGNFLTVDGGDAQAIPALAS